MKEILIFAGTTEGRKLSEYLSGLNLNHTVCVATGYGEIVLKKHPTVKVHQKRMSLEEIREFFKNGDFLAVVDATHPYAQEVTSNIKKAAKETGIPLLRLKREKDMQESLCTAARFETNEDCAKALEKIKGNILLTVGSKALPQYCSSKEVKDRLYVRVLPTEEAVSLCIQQGICGKQIIAMQGPFSTEMNEAMIRQYQIACLVTKESGGYGGFREKLEAARRTGAQIFVIGRPEEEGFSFSEICSQLEQLLGRKTETGGRLESSLGKRTEVSSPLEITLAGVGMGQENGLTKEVWTVIQEADILLGAERVIKPYMPKVEKRPIYQAEEIISYLKIIQQNNQFLENQNAIIKKVAVLFSGDSGFYSGSKWLYKALEREIRTGELKAAFRVLPGISSIACLAACIGESYEDAAIYSIHGKTAYNLARRIKNSSKTFLLTSGVKDVNELGKILIDAEITGCEVTVGFQLSYEEQKVKRLTPLECCYLKEEGLYTCFVKNSDKRYRSLVPGIADREFIRDKIPMTKEEVREVSICKLHLHSTAVVYDIGSGTGSAAIEIAGLSDEIQVFAVERKKEAAVLIERNKKKFYLENIKIVETEAPKGLDSLPKATHAFLGGSGGKMKEILDTLYHINPAMRVVINAVTIETICEIQEILKSYKIENQELVQMQVSRAKQAGNYHLMQAENPVWICAFNFSEEAAAK